MAISFAPDWQPIALAAVTLSLLLVGAVYAVGAIFNSERLRGWAKTEFLQVIASGIIVASLLVFATGMETMSQTIAGQDHITYAQNYLNDLNGKLEALYVGTVALNSVLETLGKLKLDISIIVAGASGYPFAGFEAIAHNLELAMTAIFVSIISNAVQANLLTFIKSTMMFYFLPAGVILRTFNPTRSIGAFLMALAIGLYFVFPLTYVLANESIAKMNTDILDTQGQMDTFTSSVQLDQQNMLDVNALKNFITGLPTLVWSLPGEIIGKFFQVVIADLFMQVLILPALGLAITYIFIRQLSRFLGSYVDIGAWWLFA